MRRSTFAVLLMLVLASLAPLALAQGSRPEGEPNEQAPRGPPEERGRPDGVRGKPAAIGAFEVTPGAPGVGGDVEGDHVDFQYGPTSIRGFRVEDVVLFDITVTGTAPDGGETDAKAEGAQVRVDTPSYRLRVHDNPQATTQIQTRGAVSLTLAPGATLALEGQHVTFTLDNLTGVIIGRDLRIDGATVHARDGLRIHVNLPAGGFDVHRSHLARALGKGHLGAEASFNRLAGDAIEENVVSYGNVTMRTLKAEQGNLTVEIDGHGFDGRVVVLNVDGRVLGAQKADDLVVLFDNETIRHADTFEDVLDPDDDGLQAEYYVVFDPAEQAFQLIVSVPHYSLHTLSVQTFLVEVAPSIVAGVLIGVVLLVPSAFVLFRRGKPQ